MQGYSRTGGRRGFADHSVSGAVLARIIEVTEIKIVLYRRSRLLVFTSGDLFLKIADHISDKPCSLNSYIYDNIKRKSGRYNVTFSQF